MTSHDVVLEVRKVTGEDSVGHAGTLDPLAEGVLVVGVGGATKKLEEIVQKEKEYITRIRLGEESTTDDEEGEKHPYVVPKTPTYEEIERVVAKFKGKIIQTPPLYSAIKVEGKPSYKWVREGNPRELKAREVEIKEIEVVLYEWPTVSLRVVTGPGCYIRSLARDLGKELKVGGYVAELLRTRVGDFTTKTAVKLKELPAFWTTKNY